MTDEHGLPDLPPEQMIPYILEHQREDFRKKFGRDPGPGDPIFFDPDADEPRPIDPEKLERDMIEIMARAGVDPVFMYAANKTGLIVTEMGHRTHAGA